MRYPKTSGKKTQENDELRQKLETILRDIEAEESVFNASPDDTVTEAAIYRLLALNACRSHLLAIAREQDIDMSEYEKE